MNERETEGRLRDWLDAQAPSVVPDDLRRAVVAVPTTVPVGWPDRLAAALGPRRAAVPRLAWLLLLAAGLLTALVGGMLVVGSQPARRLPAVVPPVGQVLACPPGSTPDKPGPVDQARPAHEPWTLSEMAFDRRAGRLVALDNIFAGDEVTGVETWTFDVCTNTWMRMHPDREPSSSGGGLLVYDVDSDVTILVTAREVWAYDLGADTWTLKGSIPPIDPTSLIHVTSWAYDPVTGLVVAAAGELAAGPEWKRSRPALWNYDVATDTWTPIRQDSPPAAWDRGVRFTYDASADRMIAYAVHASPDAGNETWLFDLRAGAWSRAGAVTPDIRNYWGFNRYPPEMVYDEAEARTVVYGNEGLAAYDATTDRWDYLNGGDDGQGSVEFGFGLPSGWSMDEYDPVNGRLVGLGGGNGVWAFEPATRQWTVLLEGREGGTAPTDDEVGVAVTPRPGWAPELEALLPSDVDGVRFTKTSVAGRPLATRLGKGGWGSMPLGSDELNPFLGDHGKELTDLNIAVATPIDRSRADTFAIAFQVKDVDATELARLLADPYGAIGGATATIGGKEVQVFRETRGMGFDLYVKDDVLFYVFTDGTPLIDGIVAALP
jgi:hypothetical protein